MNSNFAVAKDLPPYRFEIWHESLGEAKEEAERLCRRERQSFVILKVVSKVSPSEIPVKWEDFS